MKTWRDEISPQAVADIEAIVEAGLEIADHALVKNGELFPFGLTINGRGQRSITHADSGPGLDCDARASLGMLWNGFGQRGVELRAVAAVVDDGHQAVRVEVEHAEGLALEAVQRYQRGDDGELRCSATSMTLGRQRVWLAV